MNNKGSTTVELSLVMPVIFFIITMCIAIIVNVSQDARAQSEAYCEIYEYKDVYAAGGIKDIGKIKIKNGELYTDSVSYRGILWYRTPVKTYKTEYDKCSDRLRRWQLYGDTFFE